MLRYRDFMRKGTEAEELMLAMPAKKRIYALEVTELDEECGLHNYIVHGADVGPNDGWGSGKPEEMKQLIVDFKSEGFVEIPGNGTTRTLVNPDLALSFVERKRAWYQKTWDKKTDEWRLTEHVEPEPIVIGFSLTGDSPCCHSLTVNSSVSLRKLAETFVPEQTAKKRRNGHGK